MLRWEIVVLFVVAYKKLSNLESEDIRISHSKCILRRKGTTINRYLLGFFLSLD